MIRVKCGTCGTTQGYKTEADGSFTLPAAEERRLVARGVAEYVTRPIIGPDSPVGGEDDNGTGINPASEDQPVERLENGEREAPAVVLPGSAETVDIIDGHFDRESLLQLTRTQMEKLAGDMGVDVSRCRNKSDIADLLGEVDAEIPAETGGEAPPELGAEAPVV